MRAEIPVTFDHPISTIHTPVHFHDVSPVLFPELQPASLRLQRIKEKETYFYDTLGINQEDRKKTLNYNPVLEQNNFQELESPKEIEQFKRYALEQVKTSFFERNNAAINIVEYTVGKEGKIYNSQFPKEPFDVVLDRGIQYREANDPRDLPRERAEFEGWKQACNTLMDSTTPIGTTAIIISGPGTTEGSIYTDKFVDMYKSKKDPVTGKISITMTRFASGKNYRENFEVVKTINPNYFTDHFEDSDTPTDSELEKTFLANPIWINSALDSRTELEIMEQHFGIRKTALKRDDALKAWERTEAVAQHFLEHAIFKKDLNPEVVAKLWNALVVKNDLEVEAIKKNERTPSDSQIVKFASLHEEVFWLSTQEVKEVMAGCGLSAGFELNKNAKGLDFVTKSPFDALANSVAQFGLNKDDMGSLKFNCPACQYENTRPYGKKIKLCQNSECPDPTSVACEEKKEETKIITKELPKKQSEEKTEGSRIFLFPHKKESKEKAT